MTRATHVMHISSVHALSDPRLAVKECASLAAAGYRVTLAALGEGLPFVNEGVEVVPVPPPRDRFVRLTRTIPTLVRNVLERRPALVHFHDPELIPVGIALRLLGYRVVYDVHEDVREQVLDKYWIPRPFRRPVAWLIGALEGAAGLLMSGIVTATPQIAARFPRARTVVVRNFPRLGELAGVARPYVSRPPGRVLYLGGITSARGLDVMLEVARRIHAERGATLVLAGPALGGEAERQRLTAQVPGLIWLGTVGRGRVAELLGEARVALVALRGLRRFRESLPVKLFEYMIAGIPIVASDFPVWRDLVESSGAVRWVDPEDVVAVAGEVIALLDDPARAEKMGEGGRQLVLETLNWDAEAGTLIGLYWRVLGASTLNPEG